MANAPPAEGGRTRVALAVASSVNDPDLTWWDSGLIRDANHPDNAQTGGAKRVYTHASWLDRKTENNLCPSPLS